MLLDGTGKNDVLFLFPSVKGIRIKKFFFAVFSIQGGGVLVDLLNDYGPSISILFVVFIEAAGVFWFYGVSRFSDDIEKMLGFRPGIFWRVCWSYISPLFLLVSWLFFVCRSRFLDK